MDVILHGSILGVAFVLSTLSIFKLTGPTISYLRLRKAFIDSTSCYRYFNFFCDTYMNFFSHSSNYVHVSSFSLYRVRYRTDTPGYRKYREKIVVFLFTFAPQSLCQKEPEIKTDSKFHHLSPLLLPALRRYKV